MKSRVIVTYFSFANLPLVDGVFFGSKFIQENLYIFHQNPVLSKAHIQLFHSLFADILNRTILKVIIISFGLVSFELSLNIISPVSYLI